MTLTKEDIKNHICSYNDVRKPWKVVERSKVADELEPLDDEKTGDYLWRMQQLQKTLRGNGK